jgi:predicted DNA-binding transcriptional regulator YafY
MGTATGRRLQVLALLQTHRGITAGALAERLEVTERTARRDIAHLRDLGYRIDAEPGRFGGYTLASGRSMPPLQLDADEALAVALGLRATVGVAGLGAAAATALGKLTETVSTRLRARLQAVAGTESPSRDGARASDAGSFVALALACRAGEAVSFQYRGTRAATPHRRDAQPHRVVSVAGRWYLVACDAGTTTWRVYALDRVRDVRPLGTRLRVPAPPDDASAFVTEALAVGAREHRVRVRLFTSADLARELIAPSGRCRRTGWLELDPDVRHR